MLLASGCGGGDVPPPDDPLSRLAREVKQRYPDPANVAPTCVRSGGSRRACRCVRARLRTAERISIDELTLADGRRISEPRIVRVIRNAGCA
jgi:hypothetical protein